MKTKIFAAYLPQYHRVPENDEFWGEGFTDWNGVRKSKPLFDGHVQPRVPLDRHYYDLSNKEEIVWQAELAKKYGVSGFNIYHYWFKDGKKVLEKPAEIILNNKDIDIDFFFSWDNNSWVRSWSNVVGNSWTPSYDKTKKSEKQVLMEHDYGDEAAWIQHFMYLLPFFKDSRYMKIDGKPVFALMRTEDGDILQRMYKCWDMLAKENGLAGVYIITGARAFGSKNILDSQFVYQPRISAWGKRESIEVRIKKFCRINIKSSRPVHYIYDYEKVWKNIIRHAKKHKSEKMFFGGIVGFDDTPRRGKDGRVITGESPKLFKEYLSKLYKICCDSNKEILLLTAWNEWGEGAYLEPDEKDGYAYLEAVREIVNN